MFVFSTVDAIWQYVVIADVTVVITAHATDFSSCIWGHHDSHQPVAVKLYHQIVFCLQASSPAIESDCEPSSWVFIRQTNFYTIKLEIGQRVSLAIGSGINFIQNNNWMLKSLCTMRIEM